MTYTFNSREGESRCYSYDPDTGICTNHRNGRAVNIGKGKDFKLWLSKIGAFNVKKL